MRTCDRGATEPGQDNAGGEEERQGDALSLDEGADARGEDRGDDRRLSQQNPELVEYSYKGMFGTEQRGGGRVLVERVREA
jgi:hypothetical protein